MLELKRVAAYSLACLGACALLAVAAGRQRAARPEAERTRRR